MPPVDRLYRPTSFYCSPIVNIALCCTVFELLTLNNCDLEIWVMGHWRSFKLVLFESYYVPRGLHFFCLPWGRPCGNHAKRCMDEKTIRCLPNPLQHVPIYLQQFPSYSNRKCKKSPFSLTAAHIFVSPGDAPAIITKCVAWMERQFNACQTRRSMYLSIFNSFRVIRCLSQCVSPKIAIFTTFWFPLGTPLGQSR